MDPATEQEKGRGLRRVRVVAKPHLSIAPLLIAEEEGFFRDEGLAVELLTLESSRDGLPALIQGELEVLTGSLSPSYLSAIAQGARIRIVADKGHFEPDGCTYLALLTRPELLRDGNLLRPLDGGPWRFSLRRSSFYALLFDRAMAASGITAQEVQFLHLTGESELQALAQGRVDVTSNTGEPMQRMLDAGEAVVWRSAQELLPEGQFAVLLFGPNLLDRDSDTGVRFMTAYLRGVRQYNAGKTERNLEIVAARTGLSRQELERACWIAMRGDGRIHLQSVLELQAWAISSGLLDRELASEELWEPHFVEDAVRRLDGGAEARNGSKGE